MDSLLANYASSDDEEEHHQQPPPQPPSSVTTPQRSEFSEPSSSRSSSFFSSLPPPKSASPFQSLPQPKQSSQPSLPTAFFDDEKNEDLDEGDSLSASKFVAASIKPSSLFSSIPQPKGNPTSSSTSRSSSRFGGDGDGDGNLTKSVSMFSSLPQPNSQNLQKPKSNPSSSESQPKRVVLFKPPVNSSLLKLGEDDDDDDEEEEKRRRKASQSSFQTPSVTSFLSSIPAPRNSTTLGVISSSGSGRRAILETDVPVSSSNDSNVVNDSGSTQKTDHRTENYDSFVNYSSGVEQNVANHRENYENAATYNFGTEQNAWNHASYDSYGNYHYSVDQNVVSEAQSVSSASNAGDYVSYESYGNYMQYGSEPAGQPAMVDTEISVRIPEKRRRNEVPSEIVEVKQDELIKNRPRQDQVKLTGIAFGPSHQPASTKGKPSKLHKRKHQITSLYYDMKQKETELAERRSRGLLTKAETQAKYGW